MTAKSTRDDARSSGARVPSVAHWDCVYDSKGESDVSWFEAAPATSLELLDAAGLGTASCIIDVGGGDSRLVDHLLDRGLQCVSVLDISATALERARTRLGDAAATVRWIAADVTGDWSCEPVDLWHDRAVFHFLTTEDARERYREHLLETLVPSGSAIVATFDLDGPDRCSGLPIARYSPASLAAALGDRFTLVESRRHPHVTPWGAQQAFQYSWLRRGR